MTLVEDCRVVVITPNLQKRKLVQGSYLSVQSQTGNKMQWPCLRFFPFLLCNLALEFSAQILHINTTEERPFLLHLRHLRHLSHLQRSTAWPCDFGSSPTAAASLCWTLNGTGELWGVNFGGEKTRLTFMVFLIIQNSLHPFKNNLRWLLALTIIQSKVRIDFTC